MSDSGGKESVETLSVQEIITDYLDCERIVFDISDETAELIDEKMPVINRSMILPEEISLYPGLNIEIIIYSGIIRAQELNQKMRNSLAETNIQLPQDIDLGNVPFCIFSVSRIALDRLAPKEKVGSSSGFKVELRPQNLKIIDDCKRIYEQVGLVLSNEEVLQLFFKQHKQLLTQLWHFDINKELVSGHNLRRDM